MAKKILLIIGTRPEAIKLIPLYLELKKSNYNVQLVCTGQHIDMINQVLDFFDIKLDISLSIKRITHSLSELTSQLFLEMEKVLILNRPDLVIVQGDTTSAFVGGMCAFYNRIPVAHVEAGLRTNNKYSPFPEEINRTLISEIADFHFAPTEKSANNLRLLYKENVFLTGNTVIDAVHLAQDMLKKKSEVYKDKYSEILKTGAKNILITSHRRENLGQGLVDICEAIKELTKQFGDYNFIYPVHLNPKVKVVVHSYLKNISNVHLLDPLSYDELLFVMSNSKVILTDSGGIQEEAPSFNIPVIVMRDETERQEGIEAKCAVLAGTNKKSIVDAFSSIMNNPNLYEKMAKATNPYGDGTASKQIVKIIRDQKK